MTRINIIPLKELYDQHLIAEYREITMIPAALQRTLNSIMGLKISKIPKNYTLNKGHVYFFYNKGKYLDKRYSGIVREMKKRGFRPNPKRNFPREIFMKNNLYNDWVPTSEDYLIIRKRIESKIKEKPKWYRK
jgi:deoxyribonuclease (pyrimidine dimer)